MDKGERTLSRPAASSTDALRRMRTQRRGGTRPEQQIRRILTQLGYRYRLQNRRLPGSPDVANQRHRWAIFVHGCFWHAHPGCPRATLPKANRSWWEDKFRQNFERDARKQAELHALGYRVLVVWECELGCARSVADTLRRFLGGEIPRTDTQ